VFEDIRSVSELILAPPLVLAASEEALALSWLEQELRIKLSLEAWLEVANPT